MNILKEIYLEFVENTENLAEFDEELIHNKNSRKNKLKLTKSEYEEYETIWSLSKYLSENKYDGIDWQYQSSSEVLNNGIDFTQINDALKTTKIFENVTLEQNDLLTIKLEYKYPEINKKTRPFIDNFISLIFDRQWKLNKGFEHIDNIYKEIKNGKIIINKKYVA